MGFRGGQEARVNASCSLFRCSSFIFARVRSANGYTVDNAFMRPDKSYATFCCEIMITRRSARISYMLSRFVSTRRRISGPINYADDAVASRADSKNVQPISMYQRE